MEDLGVRLATPSDEKAMLELSLNAWRENGIMDVNPEKMLGMIKPALYLHEGLCGVIGEPGEKIEGAVLLRITTLWYNDSKILEEKAIFVDPEFRKAKFKRAQRLCEFSKMTAERLGLPLLIGVLSNERTEGKVKLYTRQFGNPAGAFFLWNGQTGHQSLMEH